jgi:O-antigen/teichoic acid export membrane protein
MMNEEESMTEDLAAANVNRTYQLAASSIAIFTFLLFFLHPKFVSGDIDALPFQAALVVMGVAIFSFAFASFYYYGASLGGRIDDAERARLGRRGDHIWVLGCVFLFLTPSLVLYTIKLLTVALVWFALWLVYLAFVIRHFPRVQTAHKS